MKKLIRSFSFLIALLLHLSLFSIFQSSMKPTQIASSITRVTLLDILSKPIHPKEKTTPIAFAEKSTPLISKNTEEANFANNNKLLHPATVRSSPADRESKAIRSNPMPTDEPIISGLDTALSGTASAVATLPKGFSDKKTIAGLKPEPAEKRSALAKELDKAVRPDCKTAYQDLGILAAPFLLHSTLTDKGCQW